MHIAFYLALLSFGVGLGLTVYLTVSGKNWLNDVITPYRAFVIGVFLSVCFLLYPLYYAQCVEAKAFWGPIKAGLYSLHGTIQVFTVDADVEMILEGYAAHVDTVSKISSVFLSTMFVLAPFLTVGVLLSFFVNLTASIRFALHRRRKAYVFSELNQKSLTLARDIRSHHREERPILVFAEVLDDEDGDNHKDAREWNNLVREAKGLNAICFQKDLLGIRLGIHSRNVPMQLFLMAEDEIRNVSQAIELRKKYGTYEKITMQVFSSGPMGEMTLSAQPEGMLPAGDTFRMVVRRVDEKRSLIYQYLSDFSRGEDGERRGGIGLFDHAIPVGQGSDSEKLIHAVIVGLGRYGKEMLKALTWYCQMDGFSLEIDAFDASPDAEEKLSFECPEQLCPKKRKIYGNEEARVSIHVHSGIVVDTKKYREEIRKLQNVSFVFVAVGSDEDNISAAASLRMLFERMQNPVRFAEVSKLPENEEVPEKSPREPVILTVVYNDDVAGSVSSAQNYSKQKFEIRCIGSFQTLYSEELILRPKLEKEALQGHLGWGTEESFYAYEYHYRSSMASAIHAELRKEWGVPGADKAEQELTKEETALIERIEHRRWNAYMRAEGYVYSLNKNKRSRNNLAKMHHNLIPFDDLSEDDQEKDRRVLK